MNILIHIDELTGERLQAQASRSGQSFDDYVTAVLKAYATRPPDQIMLGDQEAAPIAEHNHGEILLKALDTVLATVSSLPSANAASVHRRD